MNIEVNTAKTQSRTPTKEEMIARAEALLPRLRERAAEAETNRRLSDETVQEFRDAGFPKILQPKRFGGYELGPDTATEVIRTISTACGSSGWVTNLFVVHTWQASLFPIEAQEEYWAGSDDKLCSTASFAMNSKMEEVDGGVRLTGRWKFSSGCDFADWFIIMKPSSTCFDWMMIPREDVTLVDDWFVSGLSGTGSKDIVLEDVFVPAHRRVSIMDIATGQTPGMKELQIPMGRLPFGWPAIWGIPAALIGMAEGMAAAVQKTLIGKKALFTGEVQVERVANQIKLTECLSDIHAAKLIMRNRMAELNEWAAAGGAPNPALDPYVSHRDAAYVTRMMGQTAHKLTLMAGATSVYLGNPIQRFQRDINVGVTHVSLVWEEAAENYGRAVWELGPKPRG
jgi:3-hydroxy-9,10-secoandrosta-1,3,5(10)-triene-9,17-dione monooxygenase